MKPTPGFTIAIQPDTDLGSAVLVAEGETEGYEIVAIVGTINEAREAAFEDRINREPEADFMCTYQYTVWARGEGGSYRIAATFAASEL